MKFKKFILVVIVVLSCFAVFASDSTETPTVATEDGALLLANEPIFYGEESFKQRIEEKTGSVREPVGVVLSGGSARAFAHIGVLEYLEEQGIVPDFIVSNSMGSIIALMYSAGLSPSQIRQIISTTEIGHLFDFTLPVNTGLLNVDKFLSCISAYLGTDLRLEDLSIPVIVVCEDMVTKRQILISEGDFYDVFAASFALPVYFGSVQYKGHVLIDGGIANLVPLEVAYKFTNVVLVSTTFYAGKDLNLKNPLTGLNVSIDIGKRRQGVKELLNHPDAVWVRCNVEDFSFMDFESCSLISEQGYSSCLDQSEAIANLVALYNATEEAAQINNQFKEKLDAKRAENEKQIPIIKKKYDIFNRTSNIGTSSSLGVAISSHSDNGYLLRDDLLFGLKYTFSYDDLDLNLVLGASSKLQAFGYDNYDSSLLKYRRTLPTLDLFIDYYLGNNFKFNFDGTVYFSVDLKDSVKVGHTELLSQSFQYRTEAFELGLLPGSFEFIGRQTTELTFRNDALTGTFWDSKTPFSTLTANLYYSSQYFSGELTAGLQSLGWIGTSQARLFGATSLAFSLNAWSFPFELNCSFNYRFAFDGRGEVPIFSADGYTVFDPALKAQGSELSTSSNSQQYVIASTIALDWTFFSKKIGLAELILLSNNKFGVFANLLWYDGVAPTAQVGAKISMDVGFLGLKSAPLAVSLIYDFGINKVLWKLELKTSV